MIWIAGVADDSIVDGPGIRVTLFCQGCPHHCPGCQNPETWPFAGGTKMEEEALFARIRENPLARGVTFSGGEPFAQAAGFARLAGMLQSAGYEVACYTGYRFEDLLCGAPDQQALLQKLDVLIDGPFVEELKSLSLPYRGSSNQRILDVPASLREGKAVEQHAPRWQGEYE